MGGKGSGGRNKIPIEDHVRKGTYRPSRHGPRPANPAPPPAEVADLVVLPTPDGAPEPLRPLGKAGRRCWDACVVLPWVTPIDRELLQLTAENIDDRVMLRIRVLQNCDWRDRAALRSLDQLLIEQIGLLGLDPHSRGSLGIAALDVVARVSRLDQLRRPTIAAQRRIGDERSRAQRMSETAES